MMRMRRALLVLVWSGSIVVGGGGAALADTTTEDCLNAANEGQTLHTKRRLREARRQFLICSAETCPHVVRADCTRWAGDVERDLPTVVVVATSSGKDATDVEVAVDGETPLSSLDGKALPIDPGRHVFRATHRGQTLEEQIVVAEGEKNRKLTFAFGSPPPFVAASGVPPMPGEAPLRGGPPVLAFVLGGLGVAALGSFAYFGLSGRSAYSDLERSCAPWCTDAQIDRVQDRMLVADVSLGVGIALVAAAGVVWALWPTSTASRARVPASTRVGRAR